MLERWHSHGIRTCHQDELAAKTFWQDKPKHTTQHRQVIGSARYFGHRFKSRACPVATNASLNMKARYLYLRMPDWQSYSGEEHIPENLHSEKVAFGTWADHLPMLCCVFWLILSKCLSGKFVLVASSYVVWMPVLRHPRGWLGMQYLAQEAKRLHHG